MLLESCALKANNNGSIGFGSNIHGPKFSITEEPESAEKTNILEREFGREIIHSVSSNADKIEYDYLSSQKNLNSLIDNLKLDVVYDNENEQKKENNLNQNETLVHNYGNYNDRQSLMSTLKKNSQLKCANFINRDSLIKFGLVPPSGMGHHEKKAREKSSENFYYSPNPNASLNKILEQESWRLSVRKQSKDVVSAINDSQCDENLLQQLQSIQTNYFDDLLRPSQKQSQIRDQNHKKSNSLLDDCFKENLKHGINRGKKVPDQKNNILYEKQVSSCRSNLNANYDNFQQPNTISSRTLNPNNSLQSRRVFSTMHESNFLNMQKEANSKSSNIISKQSYTPNNLTKGIRPNNKEKNPRNEINKKYMANTKVIQECNKPPGLKSKYRNSAREKENSVNPNNKKNVHNVTKIPANSSTKVPDTSPARSTKNLETLKSTNNNGKPFSSNSYSKKMLDKQIYSMNNILNPEKCKNADSERYSEKMLDRYYKSSKRINSNSRRTLNKSGHTTYQNPNTTNTNGDDAKKTVTDFNEGYKEFKMSNNLKTDSYTPE